MLKYAYSLIFFLLSTTAHAQFVYQGTSPINESIDLATRNTWSKSLIFKNTGATSTTFSASIAGPDASKFKISVNRCATIPTPKNKTCQVAIEGVRGFTQREDPYIIGFDSVIINLTVTNSAAPPPPPTPVPPVAKFEFTPDVVPLLEFAPGELSKVVNLVLTNKGEAAFDTPSVTLDPAGSLGVTFVINRCTVSVAKNKTCSVQLKVTNPPDSNVQTKTVRVSVNSVETDSVVISASQTNACIANQKKSCIASNAQVANQTCAADLKSYGVCTIETCMNGYFLSNNQCSAATYTAEYSDYDPVVSENPAPCDGQINSSRVIISCKRDQDQQIVANTFCSDATPTVSTSSPQGTKSFPISHGIEIRSCPAGSSVQTLESRTCDEGYFDDGDSCEDGATASYTPELSDYVPLVPTNLQACDGTTVSNRTITACIRDADGASVATTFCSDPAATVNTPSPAGNKTFSISNGSEIRHCPLGLTTSSFVSRSCNPGYTDNGSSCIASGPLALTGGGSGGPCAVVNGNTYCSITRNSPPILVPMNGALTGKTLKHIAPGEDHVCAVANDNKVYCWG